MCEKLDHYFSTYVWVTYFLLDSNVLEQQGNLGLLRPFSEVNVLDSKNLMTDETTNVKEGQIKTSRPFPEELRGEKM